MTRSELVQRVAAANPNLSSADAVRLVALIFERITARLAAGGRVELRGFGVFTTRERNARVGRDPRTGEPVDVLAKQVCFFRAGKEIRERLNVV